MGSTTEPHPDAGRARRHGRQRGAPRRSRLGVLALVAAGGATGSLARVGLGRLLTGGSRFPWATFTVNVAGSFLLAVLAVAVLERDRLSRGVWLVTATGFCGAFTTLSTVVVQVDLDVRAGEAGSGAVYGLATLAAGIAAVLGGTAMARVLWREKDDLGRDARTTRGSRPWN